MEKNMSNATFSEMFENTWATFKSNYGLCLSFALIGMVCSILAGLAGTALGLRISDIENVYPTFLALSVFNWAISSIISFPIFGLLWFAIVRRVRGDSETKSGSFVRLIIICSICGLFSIPGTFLSGISNPGQFEELKLAPEYLGLMFEEAQLAESATAEGEPTAEQKEIKSKYAALEVQTTKLQDMRSSALSGAAGICSLVAFLFLIRFQPWAMMIACDPRCKEQGAIECMKSGWALCTGSFGGLLMTLILFSIIALLTTLACFLPGIFFGIPLYMAWVPGVYLILTIANSEIPPVVEEDHSEFA